MDVGMLNSALESKGGSRLEVIYARSEEGITLGLVDSILVCARILASRDLLGSVAVLDALRDLASDEDLAHLLSLGLEAPLD
jgi:hypothetical protein